MKFELVSALSLAAASLAAPLATEAPPSATIASIAYGGTGCPQGTLQYVLSSDHKTVNMLYPNQFAAEVGPGVDLTQARKNCQISLSIKHTAGWSYGIDSSSYIGHVILDKGVTGIQKTTYYFAGSTAQVEDTNTWVGPLDRTYFVKNQAAGPIWSPCSSAVALNINSQVRLDAENDRLRGKITTDLGKLTLAVGLVWRRC